MKITVDRTVVIPAAAAPGGSVECKVEDDGSVSFGLTHEGTRMVLYLAPHEAEAIGCAIIKCSGRGAEVMAERARLRLERLRSARSGRSSSS